MVRKGNPARHSARLGIGASSAFLAAMLGVGSLAATAQAQGQDSDTVYLRNTLPDKVELAPGNVSYRIIGGFPAKPGAWPSMVTIQLRWVKEGKVPVCGGAIIDAEWVLTAGHCVTADSGGVEQANQMFIREGVNSAAGGRAINVRQVIRHESYSANPPMNDVALLRLAEPARAPRQVLMGNARQIDLQRDGVPATIIGYGLVNPQPVNGPHSGPASEVLLQANVPMVSRERCVTSYDSKKVTAATICAGTDEGGVDTCNGDSGGPLFVRDEMQQAIQAGVVSWGAGCAQPKMYGIYASVGYFETWIRSHVPNASFTPARATPSSNPANQPLATLVSGPATAQPSQLAQVNVDLQPGEKVKVGQAMTVRVTSSVSGSVIVVNEESNGQAYQIFPNKFIGQNLPGQAKASIVAGQPMSVPGPMDRFKLTITPPVGRNRIIAIVVPSEVRMDDIASQHEDMRPIENLSAFLESISDRATRGIKVEESAPKNRAVAIREYEIVN
jgi:secreted trypsin-like serine protease